MTTSPRLVWPRVLVLLLLLFVGGLGPAVCDEEEDIERQKEDLLFRLRVQRAIDNGMLWVARQQQRDGSFRLEGNQQQGAFPQSRHRFGISALATLTLAHCGYDAESPVMKRAVAYLKKNYRSYFKGDHWPQASAYSLALVVLAFHEIFASDPESDGDDDDERYGSSVRRRKNPCDYPSWVRQAIDRILDWFLKNRSELGLFRYPGDLPGSPGGPPPPGGPGGPPGAPARPDDISGPEDLSNSQYVLLALWAGSRCGYEIEKEVLESIARRLLALQDAKGPKVARHRDPAPAAERPPTRYAEPPPEQTDEQDRARGFGYTPGDAATGSMTVAGLSSLAIVKAMLLETARLDPALGIELDEGIWDAVGWLQHHYTVSGNPPAEGGLWHYYYLYGLERACVILAKRFLGTHDWYREGGELLVDAQKDDGRWMPPNPLSAAGGPGWGGTTFRFDLLDTCFALLFLKRATVLPKEPVLPPPVLTPDGDEDEAGEE